MVEIQEKSRLIGQRMQNIDKELSESAERFFRWIPDDFKRTHPELGVQSIYRDVDGGSEWIGAFAVRVTAKPFAALPMLATLKGDKSKLLPVPTHLNGKGRQGLLQCLDLQVVRTWQPRLRSIERSFEGANIRGMDRLDANGRIDRFFFATQREKKRPADIFFGVSELMWNVASIMHFANVVRTQTSRPSLGFALEVDLVHSDPLYLIPYAGPAPHGRQVIRPFRVLFPRYEVGSAEEFDEVLTTLDHDLWNSAGYQPNWELSIDWPTV
jgi:hypothetical protein